MEKEWQNLQTEFMHELERKLDNTGGMKTVKDGKRKLEKASAAHAGQAKALGLVIDKKKLLLVVY